MKLITFVEPHCSYYIISVASEHLNVYKYVKVKLAWLHHVIRMMAHRSRHGYTCSSSPYMLNSATLSVYLPKTIHIIYGKRKLK